MGTAFLPWGSKSYLRISQLLRCPGQVELTYINAYHSWTVYMHCVYTYTWDKPSYSNFYSIHTLLKTMTPTHQDNGQYFNLTDGRGKNTVTGNEPWLFFALRVCCGFCLCIVKCLWSESGRRDMGSEVKREDLWKTPSITRVTSETDGPLFFVKLFLEVSYSMLWSLIPW